MQTIEKHVDPVTQRDLLELLEAGTAPRVSIYVPTERVWNKSKQNPARLKNLLREASDQLSGHGLDEGAVDAVLSPLRELLDRSQFWQHQSDGLALFAGADFLRTYRLPLDFKNRVQVGGPFHVRPLLQYLAHDGTFYTLSLSQGGVALYRCTRHTAEEVALDGVPTSLPEAMQYDDLETHLGFHTGTSGGGGKRSAMFHGQSDAGDKANVKENVMRFFRTLDNGVRQELNSAPTPPPLVLAGLDYLRGLYGEANQYAHVTEQGVDGHPNDWSMDELHARAWEVVAPHFESERTQALDDYQQLAGTDPDRVVTGAEDVVAAAYYQRIDTLFAAKDSHVWGVFDAEDGTVDVRDAPTASAVDLLDVAVQHTLANSGAVHIVAPDEVPEHATVAAILRY
jgi:hypothetical protein